MITYTLTINNMTLDASNDPAIGYNISPILNITFEADDYEDAKTKIAAMFAAVGVTATATFS